ncbi:DNA polymerase III subunit delta [Rhodococcus sp. X156]|uniref:DNA polymerase III subunit delta n=1 Tax=Rhodococcus sp. X156 TaxID=2499145 RepID=UPI000FD738A1|nr:DNA polymerase III subunit delta [Rhodococcus sp. X156]
MARAAQHTAQDPASGTEQQRLHLVLGDEELLVDRAVEGIVTHARLADPAADVQKVRAGAVSGPELAEMLSPSLFAEARILVLEAAQEAGKDAVALILSAATDLPEGVVLVVVHAGGGRSKAMVDTLRKAGAQVHAAAKITRAAELADFVRAELRGAGAKPTADAVTALLEAVGSDLRELSAACSQLVADTAGPIDVAAVHRYHRGRAEVTGFDVAEKAVAGNRAAALESLRWATQLGVPHVLLADALADAVRTIARVSASAGGDPFRLAGQLGMPPWKVKKAVAQSRGWSAQALGEALQVVARLNADVKGAAADNDYAVERAVLAVVELHRR